MEWLFSLIETPIIWLTNWLMRDRSPAKTISPPKSAIGHSLAEHSFGDPVTLTSRNLERHAYLLGSTGAGKTNLILRLLEHDVTHNNSVAVIDLRGDLVERTTGLLAHLKVAPERVTLLDLRERDRIVGFNPLMGSAEPFVRALHLLDVVRTEADSWGVTIEETLRNSLLVLAEQDRNLTELERLLFDPAMRRKLLAGCSDPSAIGFFERYDDLSPDRQQGLALPVLNKVTPLLATEGLRLVLSAPNPIRLEEILARRGSILLVALAVDELHRSSRMLGSLIVAAISRAMFARVQVPENRRNPVRLYVDEFEAMASESFEALIAEGRRFKLSLVLSHQNFAQLPSRLRSVIRNNVGLQALFCCGFQDALELARELPEGFSADQVAGFMAGEMLLMPRGAEAQHVQCALSEYPVDPADLAAYRDAILKRIAMPRTDVLATQMLRPSAAPNPTTLQRPWGIGDQK